MAQQDTVFSGSIPQFYDRYISPALMAPYADDLVARLHRPAAGHSAGDRRGYRRPD